jgi:hypothetical protein
MNMSLGKKIQETIDDLIIQVENLQEEVLKYREKENKTRFLIVYEKDDGEVKTYEVSELDLSNSFGNSSEHRNNVGFRAFCHVRNEYRSFRHDRIRAVTRF